MPLRVSYHDLAARATRTIPREKLARAVERLSISYREGRPTSVHRSREGRAAYLVHLFPAHVCDERRLFLDELQEEISKPELRVLALGAGPGTEAVALADAWAHRAGEPRTLLRVDRVDLVRDWDESFGEVRDLAVSLLQELDPALGVDWKLDAPSESLALDLSKAATPALLELASHADIIIVANLVSELEPRSTPVLPPGFVANLGEIARVARAGASVVVLDRGHAPGVPERVSRTLEELGRARASSIDGPYERETRCACALTRETKALYKKVSLPTTKVEDRPVSTTRTIWGIVRFT